MSKQPIPRKTQWMAAGLPLMFLVVLTAGIVNGYLEWQAATTRDLADRCTAAVRARRWKDAELQVAQLCERRPLDGATWLMRADVAQAMNKPKEAAEALGRVPRTDPRYEKAMLLRGDLLLDEVGDLDRAIENWETLLQHNPQQDVAVQRLVYVFAMTLQKDRMVSLIRKAIPLRIEPREVYGYLLLAPNLVFADGFLRVSHWLKNFPKHEQLRAAQAIYATRTNRNRELRLFGESGETVTAEALVAACRRDFPDNPEILAYLIDEHIKAGRASEAIGMLERLPAAAEADHRFWRYLGQVYDSQKKTSEAEDAFRKSLEMFPLDWRTHHELAGLERTLGRVEKAAFHAEFAVRGKQLERELLELQTPRDTDAEFLKRLLALAGDCGDANMVDGLTYRLRTQRQGHVGPDSPPRAR